MGTPDVGAVGSNGLIEIRGKDGKTKAMLSQNAVANLFDGFTLPESNDTLFSNIELTTSTNFTTTFKGTNADNFATIAGADGNAQNLTIQDLSAMTQSVRSLLSEANIANDATRFKPEDLQRPGKGAPSESLNLDGASILELQTTRSGLVQSLPELIASVDGIEEQYNIPGLQEAVDTASTGLDKYKTEVPEALNDFEIGIDGQEKTIAGWIDDKKALDGDIETQEGVIADLKTSIQVHSQLVQTYSAQLTSLEGSKPSRDEFTDGDEFDSEGYNAAVSAWQEQLNEIRRAKQEAEDALADFEHQLDIGEVALQNLQTQRDNIVKGIEQGVKDVKENKQELYTANKEYFDGLEAATKAYTDALAVLERAKGDAETAKSEIQQKIDQGYADIEAIDAKIASLQLETNKEDKDYYNPDAIRTEGDYGRTEERVYNPDGTVSVKVRDKRGFVINDYTETFDDKGNLTSRAGTWYTSANDNDINTNYEFQYEHNEDGDFTSAKLWKWNTSKGQEREDADEFAIEYDEGEKDPRNEATRTKRTIIEGPDNEPIEVVGSYDNTGHLKNEMSETTVDGVTTKTRVDYVKVDGQVVGEKEQEVTTVINHDGTSVKTKDCYTGNTKTSTTVTTHNEDGSEESVTTFYNPDGTTQREERREYAPGGAMTKMEGAMYGDGGKNAEGTNAYKTYRFEATGEPDAEGNVTGTYTMWDSDGLVIGEPKTITIKPGDLGGQKWETTRAVEDNEKQRIPDCYLISAIDSLTATPEGREAIRNAITNNNDGSITVTFADGWTHTFSQDDLTIANLTGSYTTSDPDLFVLELAFEEYIYSFANEGHEPKSEYVKNHLVDKSDVVHGYMDADGKLYEDSEVPEDQRGSMRDVVRFIQNPIIGGDSQTFMSLIMGDDKIGGLGTIGKPMSNEDKAAVNRQLDSMEQSGKTATFVVTWRDERTATGINDEVVLYVNTVDNKQVAINWGGVDGHELSILKVEGDVVTIIDPNHPENELKITRDELMMVMDVFTYMK